MSLPRALAALALLASSAVAAGETRRVELPRLWASVVAPAAWKTHVRQDGFTVIGPDGKVAAAVALTFEEGDDAKRAKRLRDLTEVPPQVLASRGASAFRSGTIERRGAWSLSETSERGRDGKAVRDLHAVAAAPGGWYLLEAEAADGAFAALRPDVLRLLDSFRRAVPPLALAPYADPDGHFSVLAPTAPWRASPIPAGGGADFLGVPGPQDQPGALISIQRVERGGRYPDADAYVREETRAGKDRASGTVLTTRTAAGTWRRFETSSIFTEGSPERAPLSQPLTTAHAVLERPGELFILTFQAPPASFGDYRPAFDRVVASFKPASR